MFENGKSINQRCSTVSVEEVELINELEETQLIKFVESISQMVLVLDQNQRIAYANKSYHDFFHTGGTHSVFGEKPGDAFNCKNAACSPNGCGTTRFCKSCGAANAIAEAVSGITSTKECKILTTNNEAINLQVTASPVRLANKPFTMFSMIDISHEKRRRSLERIFIHDILNIAGGINGLSSIFKEIDDPEEMRQIAETISKASNDLIEEIQAQRELGSAERGDLNVQLVTVQSQNVLEELKYIYNNHDSNYNKEIHLIESEDFTLVTDKVLLKRILGNMIKNAIESSVPNDSIELRCQGNRDTVRFEVHNKSVIPEDVQGELFKRFYSTKQNGRGLGTYSMKLLGEKYLGGKVWFDSSAEKGTSFYLELAL